MHIKRLRHGGWENNLQLANPHVELIISLDVGPRILSYSTPEGANILKNFPEQFGQSGESEWKVRGGHRFWIAPEDEVLTYIPDNVPVKYDLREPNGVRLVNEPVEPRPIRKELDVSLDAGSSQVTLVHTATNESSAPMTIATWGLTVLDVGGLEIIPLPPLGEHPRDLLPNRLIVPWPYTDMTDPRWRFGWRFITLRQTHDGGPTKLGLMQTIGWAAYLKKGNLFIKSFEREENEQYPDFGCNYETFTDPVMLEMETLGPLRTLQPGESVSHTEKWFLLGKVPEPPSLKENDLAAWIEPLLARVNLSLPS
jgi:hypothetical protein